VTVEGAINGESTSSARTIEMTLDHGGDTYTVSEPGVQSDTTEQSEQVTVEQSYGPLRSAGGPVLFLAGLAGASGLVYARHEVDFALTPAEREYLSYRTTAPSSRSGSPRFGSPNRSTSAPRPRRRVRDLVDFAIDNDTGVVEDPGTGAYHAVTDEFVYTPTLRRRSRSKAVTGTRRPREKRRPAWPATTKRSILTRQPMSPPRPTTTVRGSAPM